MLPQPSLPQFAHTIRLYVTAGERGSVPPRHSRFLLKALPTASLNPHGGPSSLPEEAGNIPDSLKILELLKVGGSAKGSSWESLIRLCIKRGDFGRALSLYQVCEDSMNVLDPYVLVGLLKACSSLKEIEVGNLIYRNIVGTSLLQDLFIGSAFVDMFSKCGRLQQSQEVFDTLPIRDIVIWTALLSGYAQCGYGREALIIFWHMEFEGVSANPTTVVCVLKACGSAGDVDQGRKLHGQVETSGVLEINLFVGNALVDMYAKCGYIQEARYVFEKLHNRDSVSWNTLIGSYVEQCFAEEAFKCFEHMQLNGISPNCITYSWILQACSNLGLSVLGQEMHDEIEMKGLLINNDSIGTALVDMYAKCGLLLEAQKVFENCLIRDVVSWNALIAGYVLHEQGNEALECLERMVLEGVFPSLISYSCCLKACSSIESIGKGQEIHAETARQGSSETSSLIGTALIDMYGTLGMVEKAREVLDKFLVRDISSWNALISGYSRHDCCDEVLHCFKEMQGDGIYPDSVTFACILKSCACLGYIDTGVRTHGEIVRRYMHKEDIVLGSMVVSMYAELGMLKRAQEVFGHLLLKDTVSWTSLIAGYAQQGCSEEALACFEEMQCEIICPDVVTYACVLNIFGCMGAVVKGMKIHGEVVKKGLLERDLSLSCTLIDMYAKSGNLPEAKEVHDRLPVRDVVSWNVLIGGYIKHAKCEEALILIKQMQCGGVYPDLVTSAYILKACGNLGACEAGIHIHADAEASGLLLTSPVVTTALIDMYAKCGLLAKAEAVFNMMPEADIVAWNALISGYALIGGTANVIAAFRRILADGCEPNSITYITLLNACSHNGMVDIGCCFFFDAITKEFDLTNHSSCMIDLLCRAGQLETALDIVEHLPSHPSVVMWLMLLVACIRWSNAELGESIFEQVLELHENESAAYVCMGTLYVYAAG